MKNNATHNLTNFNLSHHEASVHPGMVFQKGILKNLREQSPFQEGTRNKDWINPSLSSNVLFYDHGTETASNHHIQARRINNKGYNLNHYVAYDIIGNAKPVHPTQKEIYEKNLSTDVRKEKSTSDHERAPNHQRQVRAHPEDHAHKISSDQRISVERSRSPVASDRRINQNQQNQKAEPQYREQALNENDYRNNRQNSPIHNDQRIDQNYRYYDRSMRSGSDVGHHGQRGLVKSASQHQIQETYVQNNLKNKQLDDTSTSGQKQYIREENNNNHHLDQNLPQNNKLEEPSLQRSRSAVSIQNPARDFSKVSSSNVSNPDALVCDYCVNKNLHDGRIQMASNFKQNEADHNRQVAENLKRQIEDDKRRHIEKVKMYQDAINAQLSDHQMRKHKNRELEAVEQQKVRNMLDNAGHDDSQKLHNQQIQKQRYIVDLNDQMAKQYEARNKKYQQELEADKNGKALLINDEMRDQLQQNAKLHYQRNIKNQLDDQTKQKDEKKEQQRLENDAYRKRVQEMINKDIETRKAMEKVKKQAFIHEVDRHLDMRNEYKQMEHDAKKYELDNIQKKFAQEKDFDKEKALAKKNQMQEYIKTLGCQIADKTIEKQNQAEREKQVYGGTLLIQEKKNRCYNCAQCRKIYPLKVLNKQKKVGRIF